MIAGGSGQVDDGIGMDADEAPGLADAVAFGEVLQGGEGLVLGQPAVEQRGALALGEAGLAGSAVEQADPVVSAVAVADGEVAGVAPPVQGAIGVLATKAGEVVQRERASRQAG
jgi:hypothetical protein